MYAVIDCNNFFVSCERVFRPDLEKRPVVVLSNNDGCAISRSDEAKKLDIPMGAPAFKYKEVFEKHHVEVFSANFSLYGDISQRVMKTIAEEAQQMEIYSIDEAFIIYEGMTLSQIQDSAGKLRKKILRHVGIPVSIGIASTKTLAKAANEIAKHNSRSNINKDGVFALESGDDYYELEKIPVGDIWGIGRKLSAFLNTHGIFTAAQLASCEDRWVKKYLTISGLKTVRELRGIESIGFEEVYPAKKSIISSKSFGQPVSSRQEMKEAVASFTTRAAEKLREEHEVTTHIGVAITTNYHNKQDKQYYESRSVRLLQPTSHTPELISAAVGIIDNIYKDGYRYKKATVFLFGLYDQDTIQQGLFANTTKWEQSKGMKKQQRLMQVVDTLNTDLGSGTVHFATEGVNRKWHQRRKKVSPRYTTKWEELPYVK